MPNILSAKFLTPCGPGQDSVPPIAQCNNVTVALGADGLATVDPSILSAGSTDNCTIDSVVVSQTQFDCDVFGFNAGAQSVSVMVFDQEANVDTCVATVTVLDTLSPTIFCSNVTLYLDADGEAILGLYNMLDSIQDNCFIFPPPPFLELLDCDDVGVRVDTLAFQDESGNEGRCFPIITVLDTIKPKLYCSYDTVYLDATGQAFLGLYSMLDSITDNCFFQPPAPYINVYDCNDVGTFVDTISAVDAHGNEGHCFPYITVRDTIKPRLFCSDVTVDIDSSGQGFLGLYDMIDSLDDNCFFVPPAPYINVYDCSDVGVYVDTIVVYDAHGNEGLCFPKITVTSSVKAVPFAQQYVQCVHDSIFFFDSSLNANAWFWNFGDGVSTYMQNPLYSYQSQGTFFAFLTVFDTLTGCSDSAGLFITIQDSTPPVAVCSPNITVALDHRGLAALSTNMVDAGSYDNCRLASISLSEDSFSCFNRGVQPVILTATDEAGNQDTCFTLVTVLDTLAYTFSLLADTLGMPVGSSTPLPGFIASGSCAGDLSSH